MADVSKVQGPGTPDPLGGGGKKEKVPSDQFKKIMKVEKVRETDPEEQRKRRERAEKEEENVEEEGGAPTQKEPPAPFSLEGGGPTKASPLEMQTPAAKPPSIPSAPPAASPLSSSFAAQQPPPPQAEEPPMPTTPTPQEEAPAPPMPPSAQTPSSLSTPQGEMPTAPSAPGKTPLPPSEQTSQKAGATSPLIPLEETPAGLTEEDKETFFKEFAASSPGMTLEEKQAEEEGIAPLFPAAPELQKTALSGKGEEKKEEGVIPLSGAEAGAMPELQGLLPDTGPTAIPPYAYLSPQVLDMFERMVGVMTVMTTTGISETTINLNAEQFASSVFYGTQIIIKEYSTAPREFNIQFNTSAQGASLIQANTDDLLAAFQDGNYNFRVRRFETNMVETKPFLFRRKEGVGGDEKGQQGQTQ